jgi:hypothetical protein
MRYRLGKKPARPGAVDLRFDSLFSAVALPVPPAVFGAQAGVSYGMLANDRYGDCVEAGAAHETVVMLAAVGRTVRFTDTDVLEDYATITGFVPGEDATDQGTDMQVAASYRQKTGVRDATGTRHKITAYAALRVGDVGEIALAAYLMGAAGFGMQFPSSAEDQFDAGEPWSVVPGDRIEGGHYVPIVGRAASGNLVCITWGQSHEVTPGFYQQYCDESIAYVSQEFLSSASNLSPGGFSLSALETYLREIDS